MWAQNILQKQGLGKKDLESQVSETSQKGDVSNKGFFGRFCESLRFGNLRKFLFGCAVGFMIGGIGQKANAEFVIGERVKVPNVNTEYGELEPCISADDKDLYFRSNRPGGRGNWDIWVASRDSVFHPWKTPANLGPIVNDKYHIECPSISADGLKLYFSSSRPGVVGWEGIDTDYDIWVTKRETKDSPWSIPTNSGELALVNSAEVEGLPSISADGLELYFYRGGDILVSSWDDILERWQNPENFSQINFKYIKSHPYLSYNGLAFYFSGYSFEGETGYGGRDIFVSTRTSKDSDNWSVPRNLGPQINSSFEERGPKASVDGRFLFFEVWNRDDPFTARGDIYQVSITPVLDFNADGKVDSRDLGILEGHLGDEGLSIADVDIYPSPLGDGKIDQRDVTVFLEGASKEDRLMGHWKLDEAEGDIAYDSVGSWDGIVHGINVRNQYTASWQPDIGKVDGALLLDGVNDYIDVPFVWNPAYGEFSAFSWVFGGDLGQAIISQRDSTGAVGRNVGGDGRTWLGIDSLERKLMTGLTNGGRAGRNLVSEQIIYDNGWNHLGVVWDGARRHLYVNGEEVASDAEDLSYLLSSDGGLHFGAGNNLSAGSFLNGLLDDIKIYAKSLSNEEVRKLYTEGSIASYTGIPTEPPVTPALSAEGFETGSFSEAWSSYGDASWFVTTEGYSGNYGARAGSIGDDEISSLEVGVDCIAGKMSFYRKTSSESGFDYLRFYIDGTKQDEWAGGQDWGKVDYSVPEGQHAFTWTYSKDSSVSEGEDSAWIDDVEFPVN